MEVRGSPGRSCVVMAHSRHGRGLESMEVGNLAAEVGIHPHHYNTDSSYCMNSQNLLLLLFVF